MLRFSNVDINTGEILQTIHFKKNIGGNLWASLRDSDGNWWFGIGSLEYKRRIVHYNPTTQDSATVFVQYNDFEAVKQAHIIQFLEDGPIIWASSNEGLIAIDKQKGVVGVYKKDAKEGFQLPFTDIYWLYKDADNVYWAATNQSGLVKFTLDKSLKVKYFKQYTTDNGLSSNVTLRYL